jgi:hypothetical protein
LVAAEDGLRFAVCQGDVTPISVGHRRAASRPVIHLARSTLRRSRAPTSSGTARKRSATRP